MFTQTTEPQSYPAPRYLDQVGAYVEAYVADHNAAPTYRQIANALNTTAGMARHYVDQLRKHGELSQRARDAFDNTERKRRGGRPKGAADRSPRKAPFRCSPSKPKQSPRVRTPRCSAASADRIINLLRYDPGAVEAWGRRFPLGWVVAR